MNKLLIVIVTYNGEKWIDKCLSHFTDKPCGWEVLIIDNCSSDDTVNIIENKHDFTRIIKLKNNLGFEQANNIGLKIALKENFEYVLLLNQDAYITQTNIKKMMDIIKDDPEYYIVCPLQFNGEKSDLDFAFKSYLSKLEEFYFDLIKDDVKKVYPISFCNAACWLMSMECIKNVGGFNPAFFHYGEDDNYCARVKFHKKKIGIATESFFCHDRYKRDANNRFFDLFSKRYRQYLLYVSDPNNFKKKFLFERIFLKFGAKMLYHLILLDYKNFYCYFNLLLTYTKNYKNIRSNTYNSLELKAFLE